MICPKCNFQSNKKSKFCENCGNALTSNIKNNCDHLKNLFKFIKNFIFKHKTLLFIFILGIFIFNTFFRYQYLKAGDIYFYKIDRLFGVVKLIEVEP